MNRALLGVLAGCAILAVPGCNPSSSVAAKPPEQPVNAAPTGSAGSETVTPKTGPTDRAIPPKIDAHIPPETFRIPKPDQGKEKRSSMDLADLGDKMDKAWFGSGELLCETDTVYDVQEGKGSGKATIKVKDAKTFNVQYYTSDTEATLNRIIANGTEKISFYKSAYQRVPNTGPTGKGVEDTSVASFARNFNREMFAPFETGASVWGPVFRAWDKGADGATATVHETNYGDHVEYRIVAQDSKGAQMDIRVDGKRFLPVAVRSVIKTPKGTDNRMWDAKWKLGGHHTDKDFVLPRDASTNR
ncbi:MAG: hypothetical protein JSS66_11565 [Armatimonadetes bacterium]|nr:hypothetical protein [Armatimonadota bacterium]